MKSSIVILIITVTFSFCSNDNASIKTGSKIGSAENFRQNFVPTLTGSWLMTDYMTEIEKTKSALKSAGKLQDVVEMITDGKTTNDTLEVNVSFNNHEGDGFMLMNAVGQTPNSYKTDLADTEISTNFYELGYELINKDTFMFLYHYDSGNKLLDKRQFSRSVYNPTDVNRAGGIQYFVNDKLLAGKYTCMDANNKQYKVQFLPDGTVTGFPDVTTYFIFTDFNGGPVPKFDEMFLESENTSTNYGFQIAGNTINIYEIAGDEENAELGKMKYKLVKQ